MQDDEIAALAKDARRVREMPPRSRNRRHGVKRRTGLLPSTRITEKSVKADSVRIPHCFHLNIFVAVLYEAVRGLSPEDCVPVAGVADVQ
jgi:hypothetical protein